MSTSTTPLHFDLLIQGGQVIDGSGAEPARADVGVVGDRIVAVGDLRHTPSASVLDASGCVVAPGFIDIHTHSDVSVTYNAGQGSAVAMGVTTQVVGNCGLSLGYATTSQAFDFEKRWLKPHGARITWSSYGEFLRQIEERGVATNMVALAGHGTLRKRVMGVEERAPAESELQEMELLLGEAMGEGVWGLSSGLEYPPSSYAGEAELTRLCRVVAREGGFYATHIRNEGDALVEAVQEALNVSAASGAPLQLSHHKAEGRRNWPKIEQTLSMVDDARDRGMDVQLDQYPYTAFMTSLAIQTLPPAALTGNNEELTDMLKIPSERQRIRSLMLAAKPEFEQTGPSSVWNSIQIAVCRGRPDLQGRTIADIAGEAGAHPADVVLEILEVAGGLVSALNFSISEESIAQIMRYPQTMIGSDGVATHPGGTTGGDLIHPRAYGTFPRVLGRYARELNVISPQEAIRKMTSMPAERLGIADRGRILAGCYADLVVYNPETIADRATFADPHRYPEGIRAVLVNGVTAFQDGAPTHERAGKVLRR